MSNSTEKRITAKMVLDSTGFNKELSGINQQLKITQSELKASSAQVGVFGNQQDKARVTSENLQKQIDLQRQKVDVYKKSIEDSTSKMNTAIKAKDELKKKIDEANIKYQEAIKLYGKESEEAKKAKETVDDLTKEYGKKEKAIESTAKRINNYTINTNKAEEELAKMENQLKSVNEELAKSDNKWITAGESLKTFSEKANNVGKAMSGAGDSILKATAPLVGLGAVALKVAGDFEEGMKEVQAISGATGEDLDKLSEKAKEMGATTKFSASESASALKYMAMAGWDTTKMLGGLEGVMNLAAASGEDLALVSDIVTDAMTAFGLEADKAGKFADILASASSNANTNVGLLGESFKYVAPVAGALGYSAEDTAIALGLMANSGIKASQSGTSLRGALTRLIKPTNQMNGWLDRLNFTMTDSEGNMKSLKEVMDELRVKFADLTEEEQAQASATLFGKEAMSGMLAIINASTEDYVKLTEAIYNSEGVAKKMADTMNDNLKGELVLLKSQLEGVAIQLGELLIPAAREFIKTVSEWVTKFSNLDEQTKKNLIKLTGFTVAVGGFLKVGGSMISTVGTIAGGLSKLSLMAGTAKVATAGVGTAAATAGGTAGLGALATGFGSVALAAAPWILAAGAVVGAGYLIKKNLEEEVVPSVDLFADKVETTTTRVQGSNSEMINSVTITTTKISEETKKMVGAYMDMDTEVKKTINGLYISSTSITEEMSKELVGKFESMGIQINTRLEEKRSEDLQNLRNFFNESKNITQEEQNELLGGIDTYYNERKTKISGYEQQIKDIIQKASNDRRQLTNEEVTEINNLQEQMKNEAIKILSENEIEAKVILERMKENNERITAEIASDTIKEVNRSTDEAIKKANEDYEERLRLLIKMRDESKVISAEQADNLIKEAQRQRDETIAKAEETKNSTIAKLREMNTELEKQVDLATGKILTKWDKLKNWWNSWKPEAKSFDADYYGRGTGVSVERNEIGQNYNGTDNWRGGLTTLHEKGYEVYDLPKGTRVYNHEASEDMVRQTAQEVAMQVASNMGGGSVIIQNMNVSKDVDVDMMLKKIEMAVTRRRRGKGV